MPVALAAPIALAALAALAAPALAVLACHAPADARSAPPAELAILTDSYRPAMGEPLPATSPIFDGHAVHLRAARGETLGMSVLTSATAPVSLAIDAGGIRVEAYGFGLARVREASTAMYGDSRGPGDYRDELIPTGQPVTASAGAFFDLVVGAAAVPGRHRGRLTVGERVIPVQLTVEAFAIDVTDRPLVWAYFSGGELGAAGAAGADNDDYVALFRRHGVVLADELSGPRWRDQVAAVRGLAYWPVFPDRRSPQKFLASARQWAERLRGQDAIPFAIPIDEPATLGERLRVRALGTLLDVSGLDESRFMLAVTDRPRAVYGDAVDVYISPLAIPAASGNHARHWTYNGKPPRAGNMVIDAPDDALRSWGWIAYRYDVELWYVWNALYFRDRHNGGATMDVARDAVTYDERARGGDDFGNGDGVLAYPGAHPSLRLKTLRRGLQDRALLHLLAATRGPAAAARLAREVVPRALGEAGDVASWPAAPADFDAARDRLLDALEGP